MTAFEPAYMALYRSGELQRRAQQAAAGLGLAREAGPRLDERRPGGMLRLV